MRLTLASNVSRHVMLDNNCRRFQTLWRQTKAALQNASSGADDGFKLVDNRWIPPHAPSAPYHSTERPGECPPAARWNQGLGENVGNASDDQDRRH